MVNEDDPEIGTLRLFPHLPDEATQRAFIDETLAAIRQPMDDFESPSSGTSPDRWRTSPWVQEVLLASRAELATALNLRALFEDAAARGDAREAGRIFREIVIVRLHAKLLSAEWRGCARVSACEVSMVRLEGLVGGTTLLRMVAQTGHARGLRALSFSPEGSRLVTAGDDGRVISWDASTGRELFTWWFEELEGRGLDVSSVALAPDGKRLLVGYESGHLVRWKHDRGPILEKEGRAPLRAIAFSSDGSRVVTASDGLTLWSNDRSVLRRLGQRIDGEAFSVDGGMVLTVGPDHHAILHDAEGERLTLDGPDAPLCAAALSADGGRAATLDVEGTVDVWDARDGQRLKTWTLDGGTQTVALSYDGRLLLTWSQEAGAQLWEIESDPPLPRASVTRALAAVGEPIRAVALSPSTTQPMLVVGTESGGVWAIDTTRGDVLWSMPGMRISPYWITFSVDGRQLTVTDERRASHTWDLASGRLTEVPAGTLPDPGKELRLEPYSYRHTRLQILRHQETREPLGYYEPGKAGRLVRAALSTAQNRVLLVHRGGSTALLDATRQQNQWLFTPQTRWRAKLRDARAIALSPNGRFVVAGTRDGVLHFRGDTSAEPLCHAVALPDGRWAVADDEGRFDAADGGTASGFHWVLDLEPIALEQLKARYYDPFLLAKKLGWNPEPLRPVSYLAPKLFPAAHLDLDARSPGGPTLHLRLTDRGGGMGPVHVSINGKEAFVCRILEAPADGAARVFAGDHELPTSTRRREDGALQELSFSIPLAGHPYLLPGGDNRVTVVTTNRDELLSSRDLTGWIPTAAAEQPPPEPPHLWAIVVGVSSYADPALRLRYAAKDAIDIAAALRIAGAGLFGEARVHLTLLSTEPPIAEWPTRAQIEAAFQAARAARSGDVLVVYLAGHGAQYKEGPDDDFCFLTQDAVHGALADPEVRRRAAISSQELTAWIQQIPALKQVLVLDTCHAGQLVADWTEKRDIPSSHVRAIERMKDRMGLYVLAGAAADAPSYEASRYAQGLLTYALLFGMRGPALREGRFVDVHPWLTHAIDHVPRLAEGIGGVQRPLLAVPRGGATFDVGALEPTERARIPMAIERPLVVRAGFQDEDEMVDTLDLGEKVDDALRDLSASARDAPFVFVEINTLPGAYKIVGRYRVADGEVAATARLVRDRDRLVEFPLRGRADAAGELARAIVERVSAGLRAGRPS